MADSLDDQKKREHDVRVEAALWVGSQTGSSYRYSVAAIKAILAANPELDTVTQQNLRRFIAEAEQTRAKFEWVRYSTIRQPTLRPKESGQSLTFLHRACDLVPLADTRKAMKKRVADDHADVLEFTAKGRIWTARVRTWGCWALCIWDVLASPVAALTSLLKGTKSPS